MLLSTTLLTISVTFWGIAVALVTIFSCDPVQGFWDHDIPSKCIDSKWFCRCVTFGISSWTGNPRLPLLQSLHWEVSSSSLAACVFALQRSSIPMILLGVILDLQFGPLLS
ncbi:hypothetical protein GGR58DRAFT_276074 [Xylaria digitata]|nr:hypothetical protein GGR58DRAFT_276074 [Xylaria digitata]